MGSEGSLPCSQQPNNCPCLKPDKSLPRLLYLFNSIHFNNSAPPTSGSSNLVFPSGDRLAIHLTTTIHFDSTTCRTTVTKFGVNSMPASWLSTPYGKQFQHGGRANSRGACSCPRTTETGILPRRKTWRLVAAPLLGWCCTPMMPGYGFLWNWSNYTASYLRRL